MSVRRETRRTDITLLVFLSFFLCRVVYTLNPPKTENLGLFCKNTLKLGFFFFFATAAVHIYVLRAYL